MDVIDGRDALLQQVALDDARSFALIKAVAVLAVQLDNFRRIFDGQNPHPVCSGVRFEDNLRLLINMMFRLFCLYFLKKICRLIREKRPAGFVVDIHVVEHGEI